jgi:hypothetical protein
MAKNRQTQAAVRDRRERRTPVHLLQGFGKTGETGDRNLKELLVPYPADQMRMWENSPRGANLMEDRESRLLLLAWGGSCGIERLELQV